MSRTVGTGGRFSVVEELEPMLGVDQAFERLLAATIEPGGEVEIRWLRT
jgi:hypothetical protein